MRSTPLVHSSPGPVLVVDDDENTRTGLSALLTLRQFSVVTAANGAEALEKAREHQPCLILLDLVMPVMDGERFRAEQQRDEHIKDIPVIVLSARSECVDVAQRMGAVSCLTKPVSLRAVVDEVARRCAVATP